MTNITMTSSAIQFDSVATGSIQLTEPKWELVDGGSFHVITQQGVYCITTTEYSINNEEFDNSEVAITYLNSL